MRSMRGHKLILAVAALVWPASSLASQDLLSFTFSDLDGDFVDSGGGAYVFTAADDSDTDGDVTRLASPAGDAFFAGTVADSGFPASGSFTMELGVGAITTGGASSVGTLEIVDADGDVIAASVSGGWINVGGSANFVGLLSSVTVTSDDGTFDGTDSGSFSTSFAAPQPYTGNVINLSFGEWFTDGGGTVLPFSDVTTLTSGAVVPEPATLSLLAIGGLATLLRRRRR